MGCVECKNRLADVMIGILADMHVRRTEYEKNPVKVKEILAYGAERARIVAASTMAEVRAAMNLK